MDDIYQMRPDFEHVNKESMERIIPGPEIALKAAQKVPNAMKIVDDTFKEQQQRELELEMEEEQELVINPIESEKSYELLSKMTTPVESPAEPMINIKSDKYLPQILPISSTEEYQAQVTKQREGMFSISTLNSLQYKEFLVTVLMHFRIIQIKKFENLLINYFKANPNLGQDPSSITLKFLAQEIHEIAWILPNGYCIIKSSNVQDQDIMQALRNKIIFTLFSAPDSTVLTSDFAHIVAPAQARPVLRELCVNRAGKWAFKGQEYAVEGVYEEIGDKALVEMLEKEIENVKKETESFLKQSVRK